MSAPGPFKSLYNDLTSGSIDRREFIDRAMKLGMGAAAAYFVANAATASAAPGVTPAGWAFVAQEGAAARPSSGTEGQTRGSGGEVKLIQWQAPTHLSPHVASGIKDYQAAALVLEPMVHYLPDGTLIPNLVEQVPTVENGLISEDLTEVTYKLLPGIVWSDGQPLTAADVAFTWEWIMNPDNGSTAAGVYAPIANVEAVDEMTAKVTFNAPNLLWFEPHAGTNNGFIYPKHILEAGEEAHNAFRQAPTGTGPYKVESFSEGDQVTYVINDLYREPNKPFFDRVNLKGGGDAASAARAVLQTGDYDFAWNLQVEPQLLNDLQNGGKGTLYVAPSTGVERINFQFADPNVEVEGERAHLSTQHPIWSDIRVRQAFAMSIDRDTIGSQLYYGNENEFATANLLSGIPSMTSPNTAFTFDVEGAKALLDEAGWVLDGNVRKKDGVELKVNYATSINSVRQKTQAVVKQGAEEAGFTVDLLQVDAGIYFDSSPGNDQTIGHFYWDLDMFQSLSPSPIPVTYMNSWYAGENNVNVAQASNDWSGNNYARYVNPEFDALYEQMLATTDTEAAAELFIQMNDLLVNDYAAIALVNAGSKAGYSNTLNADNLALGPFEYNYWNIVNWNRVAAE
jgi:peptide/nickel transport system substrate-binding protein